MINWFDMPAEGLSNGGLFEIKELTATENKVYQKDGEVYNKVTVNVEGGGGSSDFSTAEVTFSGTENSGIDGTQATMPLIISTPFDAILPLRNEVIDETYTIVLYKGKAIINIEAGGLGTTVTASGNIEVLEGTTYLVTGDCTITIS